MLDRRAFVALLGGALPFGALGAEPRGSAVDAAVAALQGRYVLLRSYLEVTTTRGRVFGLPASGEARIAYARPGHLCMQSFSRGELVFTNVIDGGR